MTKKILLSALILSMAFMRSNAQIGVNAAGSAPTTLSMFEVKQASNTDATFGIYVEHTGGAGGTGSRYAFQAINNGASLNNIAAYLSATGGTNNYALIIPNASGNVGIGDITPASLFTVGNGDLFQVNSAGAITSAAGITSSGAITFSGLSSTGIVHNSAAGLLSTSAIVNADITNATIDLQTKVTGVLPVANGGTATSTAFTQGSVLFAGASGVYSQNNSKLFWDNTNTNLGINTATPDASSLLDITSTSKGVLIPRVTLNSLTTNGSPVSNPAYGLLVFNYNGTQPWGVYYNASSTPASPNWTILAAGGASASNWTTTGNSSVVDGTHFLGTVSGGGILSFRVNGINSGRLDNVSKNTFLGYTAGSGATNAADANNAAIGDSALYTSTTGARNVAVGGNSLKTIGAVNDNTAVGYNALKNSTASQNIAVGSGASQSNTSGTGNTVVGYQALINSTTGSSNTVFGYQAIGQTASASTAPGTHTAIGYQAMYKTTGGADNVGIGKNAFYNLPYGTGNVAVGKDAGAGIVSSSTANASDAYYNVVIGFSAMGWNATKATKNNVAVGGYALLAPDLGINNTAVGFEAVGSGSNITGSDITAVGYQALKANTAAQNTAVGSGALVANTTGTGNTALGYQSLNANTQQNNSTAVGYQALQMAALNNGGGYNTAVGYQALKSITDGNQNVAMGNGAMQNATRPFGNVAIGDYALTGNINSGQNVAVGNSALRSYNYGGGGVSGNNVAVGTDAQRFLVDCGGGTAVENTGVGTDALRFNPCGAYNTAIGSAAGRGVSGNSFSRNSVVGYQAGNLNTTGADVTALGYQALLNNTVAQNTAVGSGALKTVTTGTANTALGYNADASATITNATAIGSNVSVTASNTMRFGDGNVTAWGFGKNVAGANVIENVVNGAVLTNGGVWTDVSDSTLKSNINNISYGLNDVLKLRPVSYSLKINGRQDIGFIAQEVKNIVPEVVYGESGGMSLSYGQLTSVLTKAIQEQQKQIEELKTKNEKLEKINASFVSEYSTRIKNIEQILNAKAEK